jgi:hypothetical protein
MRWAAPSWNAIFLPGREKAIGQIHKEQPQMAVIVFEGTPKYHGIKLVPSCHFWSIERSK